MYRKLQEAKEGKISTTQQKIDGLLVPEPRLRQFSRDTLLHAEAQFIICNDQALTVADNATFRNCLVAMRAKTTRADLPSTHEVRTYIHNQSVAWLKELKTDIEVSYNNESLKILRNNIQNAPGKISTTADGWTTDNTKALFFGMTAHWIDVKDGKWKLQAEVVGFKGISGEHNGWNLGRYFVGLCDRVGIWTQNRSKVS